MTTMIITMIKVKVTTTMEMKTTIMTTMIMTQHHMEVMIDTTIIMMTMATTETMMTTMIMTTMTIQHFLTESLEFKIQKMQEMTADLQQMILTCDRYPKEIEGVEERLKSRFGWGLTVAVEPPDLETRVAILMKKAEQSHISLAPDAAFFIAQRIRSNVRELEGALKRVIASANFTGRPFDIDLIKDSLKDLLALQDKQVSLDNIKRKVAEYYKIKVADLMSKRRNRSVARPRQVAMAMAKELTHHSLPEIGDAFGGRDHTTVLHACRKIRELRDVSPDISEDYQNLLRALTT